MLRTILIYGAPELQTKSSPITDFNDEIKTLAQDMLETMYAAPGIGLAAPQVGINTRLIVLDLS
ncbi:MAG: peptide deformylase, partial [Acidobacteriota bacterium]